MQKVKGQGSRSQGSRPFLSNFERFGTDLQFVSTVGYETTHKASSDGEQDPY